MLVESGLLFLATDHVISEKCFKDSFLQCFPNKGEGISIDHGRGNLLLGYSSIPIITE